MGSGAGGAFLCRFASWGLALDVHRTVGPVVCFGGLAEASSSSARWGRGPGAGVVVGVVAPVFRLRLLALRCGVDLGLVVDPCGAQPRGWRVVLCCIGFFCQFPS